MPDIGLKYTVTFDEDVKGWTSFHSYIPDWMASLNGNFYTIKNGNLYLQHDVDNPVRNNFYGIQYDSSLEFYVNKAPSEVKFVKAVSMESNKAMDLTIVSYLHDEVDDVTQSTISVGEFLSREGKWYAYMRRNELTGDLTAKSAYGLGTVDSVLGSVITMNDPIPAALISVGDNLYDSDETLIGEIQSYDVDAGTITVDTTPTIPADKFLYGLKDGRIEGSEIRGYNFKVTLTDDTTDRLEIFAFNTQVAKSFPS